MVQTSETIRKDNPQKALQEEDEVTARAKADDSAVSVPRVAV